MNICVSSWQAESFFLSKQRRVHHHAERLQNHMLTFHPHTSIRLLSIPQYQAPVRHRSGRSDKTGKRSAARLIAGVRSKAPKRLTETRQKLPQRSGL